MLSRAADSIYWMARYIERAENVARLMDVHLSLTLDSPGSEDEQWLPLVIITGDEKPFAKRYGAATRESVMEFLAFDLQNPNSILSCLRGARENARSVREIISSEMWEQVNASYLKVNEAASKETMSRTLEMPAYFFTEIKRISHLFIGATDTTMSHGEGWNFCRMGRQLERADKTSRILDVKYFVLLPTVEDVGTPFDEVQWTAVLQSTSALEMFRKQHQFISPEKIVEFLVLDRDFPRSINYCLLKADESLHAITGCPAGTWSNRAEQHLGQLHSELAYMAPGDIIARGVHEFVDSLQIKLNELGREIHSAFFALRPVKPP